MLLGVNIDHVATLRQARGTRYPDPIHAALIAESAGADGITVHLREDRRHIQERDVRVLKETIQTRLNLEMAMTSAMIDFARQIKPEFCCIVPEKREEITTEGGLDVLCQEKFIQSGVEQLTAAGIQVSLFIDPVKLQIDAAKRTGAPYIELHTGEYADAKGDAQVAALKVIRDAAEYARHLGLKVNAGHGLHYHNVQPIARIPEILELNIGHSIVSQSLFDGFYQAVKKMKQLMVRA